MQSSLVAARIEPVRAIRRVTRGSEGQLPAPLTPLVGRTREITEVSAILRDPAVRLLTLTGPGGVGKTRLAIQVARDVMAGFDDGALFVELAAIRDPDLLVPSIVHALGGTGLGQQPDLAMVTTLLRSQRLLLVLDNFEQITAAGPALTSMLRACQHLKVLVTSRSLLNLSGEYGFPVPQLSLDAPGDAGDEQGLSDAARLFVERAWAVNPALELSASNRTAIAAIVRQLDGMPLAIELAAARSSLFGPAALLARLKRRLPLLVGGPRDQPERHRAMADAIAWSYDLLTAPEQHVFRCLGAFTGGGTLEAVEAVAGEAEGGISAGGHDAISSPEVITIIESLARQSLVCAVTATDEAASSGTVRITMLETIHEFAGERLAASANRQPRARHAGYFLALASRAEPTFWGDEAGEWDETIEREEGNLRAALAWAVEEGETDLALRLASAQYDRHMGCYFRSMSVADAQTHRFWVKRALALPGGTTTNRVRALATAAWLAQAHTDLEEGSALAGAALELAREHGDRFGIAAASFVLGVAAFHAGVVEFSRANLREALQGFEELQLPGRKAWTLTYLASLESVKAIDEGGDAEALARASSLHSAALAAFRATNHAHGIARTLHGLAYVTYKQRDLPRALTLTREVLALDWERRWPVYYYLEDIGDIAGRTGHPVVAARLYGAADVQRERAGRPVEPVFQEEYERDMVITKQTLGDEAFAHHWAAGRAIAAEQSVAEADAFCAGGVVVAPAVLAVGAASAGLSPREIEVLGHLIEGRSDREIADALFISRRTVSKHVESICGKFGVRTRGTAVAEARRRGLLTG